MNVNNCGANEVGMEYGELPQTTDGNDDTRTHTEEMEDKIGLFPSECGDSLQRHPIEKLNQDVGNNSTNQEGPWIGTNFPTPLQFVCITH
ncbi:hypothetical protein O181_032389 [Austropuccinia psidii MF-1]|uniref:Uncharacterized protein n=1 Tax=Austropuccinia psidii MF-1 TaxID=1389203 RepID=A0A9Q3CWP9_9BASI|nr:hypothetical protein [Austropuccinia psidii MF-1]